MEKIFSGIKVLDFTSNLAGPGSTAILADFGAEVIKIERPVDGDDIRSIAPRLDGQAIFHLFSNRGKKSVTIDLTDPRGSDLIKKMIKDTDVLVESYKPDHMKKFGLDYETLSAINPGLIYVSISACGQTGGYKTKPGFDIIAQAMSGVMDLTGDRHGTPTRIGTTVSDYVASLNAALSVASALYYRTRSGVGQHVDISLLDGMVAINSMIEQAATLETHPTRTGNHYPNMAPYGIYCGNNGESCIIAAYTNKAWKTFCGVIGRPDFETDPRVATNVDRVKNIDYLVENIEPWLKSFDKIDDALEIMEKAGIACCKIFTTDDVVNDKVLWERGTLVEVETPPSFTEHRTAKVRGPWIKMSKTPAVTGRAPDLGEDNVHYLTQYGLTEEEVLSLEKEWTDKVLAKRGK